MSLRLRALWVGTLGLLAALASAPATAADIPDGLYYGTPQTTQQQVRFTRRSGLLPAAVDLPIGGFDVDDTRIVYTSDSSVTIIHASGATEQLTIAGLYHIARPSLSPDGTRIAVQASASPAGPPQDLNIYVISLATGQATRISFLAVNEESPEWFPRDNRIAYSSFAPTGIDVHIYDVGTQSEVRTIADAGGIHLAISPDGTRILEPGRMKIYNVADGTEVADLRATVLASLQAAGYEVDSRYPGQANRGTYPLDGTYSPDGQWIVFDGAVKRSDSYGVILARVTTAGGSFEVLSDIIATDPSFSNNHNYSQLNPTYRRTNSVNDVGVGAVFSTAQPSSRSFLRFYNTGTATGTATVTLRDASTGQSYGQWTSPSISPGAEVQYAIGTVETGVGGFTRPSYYTISATAQFSGYLQHVLWRAADGTVTNLSTCAAGVTADTSRLMGVHTSLLNAGYPSSIAVNNTGSTAATATLAIFDARDGTRLGAHTTAAIPPGGQVLLGVQTIENAIGITPMDDMYHYVVQAEGAFTGFLQHLVDNLQAGVVTDMTTACILGTPTTLANEASARAGAVFSTAQPSSRSFLRFYNTGTATGTATVTLRDASTGQSYGQWTSPSISAGAEVQYAIGTVESGVGGFTRPSYYTISATAQFSGYFQHVLWRAADGTVTNLSTCAAGVTADTSRLMGVHTSLLNAGYPSSIAVNNTGSTAATATLAIFDARDGTRLGAHTTAMIPPGGQVLLGVQAIENAIGITPTDDMYHYVVRAEGAFTGFLQHLVDNLQAGVVTDMTTACAL